MKLKGMVNNMKVLTKNVNIMDREFVFMRLTDSGEKSSLFFYPGSRAKLRAVLRAKRNKNIFKKLRKIVDIAIYIWYNVDS